MDRGEGGCGIKTRTVGSTWFLILCPLPSVGYASPTASSSHVFPLSPSLAFPSLVTSAPLFTMIRESPTVPPNNPLFRFNRETYSIKIQNIAEQGTGSSTPLAESGRALTFDLSDSPDHS